MAMTENIDKKLRETGFFLMRNCASREKGFWRQGAF